MANRPVSDCLVLSIAHGKAVPHGRSHVPYGSRGAIPPPAWNHTWRTHTQNPPSSASRRTIAGRLTRTDGDSKGPIVQPSSPLWEVAKQTEPPRGRKGNARGCAECMEGYLGGFGCGRRRRGPPESGILPAPNYLPHHPLGEHFLIGQGRTTTVGSHLSKASLRIPSSCDPNGLRYSSTKRSISSSSKLSMSLTFEADKM